MIGKLRVRFSVLFIISLFLILALMVSVMNIMNYSSIIKESDNILSFISLNNGVFPEEFDRKGPPPQFSDDKNDTSGGHPNNRPEDYNKFDFSPEVPFESRYFTVTFDEALEVSKIDTSKIAAVSDEDAESMAYKVLKNNSSYGTENEYRYIVYENSDGNTRITFLDIGRKLSSFNTFLIISSVTALAALVITSIIFIILSGNIINPIAESYEKQKRFVSDAGHEIKTPLTIINAYADVIEIENGKSEYTDEIKQQTKRLTTLTNELVYLAKMEETPDRSAFTEFSLTDTILESAEPFRGIAHKKSIDFKMDIEPLVNMHGNVMSIEQLISVITDNAMKYSPENETVFLSMQKKGRAAEISMSNKSVNNLSDDDISHVFDRFYRTDKSRNSETGGHGIGLSVAKAIVTAHNGKISAEYKDSVFTIRITLPL